MTVHVKTRIGVVLAGMTLTGCTAWAPPPTHSELALPAHWQTASPGSAMGLLPWWTGFGDPQLTALISQALQDGPDMRAALARLKEARALAQAQSGPLWPSLDTGAGVARGQQISDVTLHPYFSSGHQALVQTAYEVDLFGRLDAQVRSAESSAMAMQFQRDATALSVAGAVATSYINLLQLDAQRQLAQAILDTRQRSLALTLARTQQGQASLLESAQSQAEFNAARLALPQLDMAITQQEGVLAVLLGRTRGPVQRGQLDQLRPQDLPDAGLPSQLLARRPDIAAAQEQLAASDAQLAVAQAQMLPSLRLTGSYGRVGSTVLGDGPFTVWDIGGSILAPLFNGGRLRALAGAADARREQALVGYERTVLVALDEVETQLDAYGQLSQLLDAATTETAALGKALHIASRRREEGYASTLEELAAQRSLLSAQQSAIQYKARLLQSEVNLFRALGGGWSRESSS